MAFIWKVFKRESFHFLGAVFNYTNEMGINVTARFVKLTQSVLNCGKLIYNN